MDICVKNFDENGDFLIDAEFDKKEESILFIKGRIGWCLQVKKNASFHVVEENKVLAKITVEIFPQ